MIVVTGGEGFIGKNLFKELSKNHSDVFILDIKTKSLDEIYSFLSSNGDKIEVVFHMGAVADTTIMDIGLFDKYNLEPSIFIWNICSNFNIPLIYASSAATYGNGEKGFDDQKDIISLKPLNPYGWSKHQFDVWAGMEEKEPPFWCGLKFFNVYGYGESHKGKMASVAYHMFNEINETGRVKLFKSHNPKYGDGEQLRDFIYIDDVVDVCLWMYENRPESGYYNVGTGKARSFNDLASSVANSLNTPKRITYIDTPSKIRDKYQYFTEAKNIKLRNAGYMGVFQELEEGVEKYMKKLLKKQ